MNAPLKARYIEIVELNAYYGVMWKATPDTTCVGDRYYHRGRKIGVCTADINDMSIIDRIGMNDPSDCWPDHCDYCQLKVPANSSIQIDKYLGTSRVYNTTSGDPEPGDLFWATWYNCNKENDHCINEWSNCDGKHLFAVLPNGAQWDIDGRANNCTKPNDTTHRCWVRHGEPPNVHVDKKGLTCSAGAGSIVSGNWHGFLHDGYFKTC